MIFSELAAGLNLWDRFTTAWKKSNNKATTEPVVTRFVSLLESHGVQRNQIPRFIGHGLTVADVQDDDTLLHKLTEELLDDVCSKFTIRREWLDGADSKIYPEHDFYKYPERFAQFLDSLRGNNPDGEIIGVLIAPDKNDNNADALIILQETIGHIGDKPICRYHLCNNWLFSYWKPRAYLTACVALAWKRKNYIHGIRKPAQFIQSLADGETLLGWNGEGIWALGHKSWDPEDMALRLESFIDGLDPERDESGFKSGLELWLELDERGLMDAGYGNHKQEFKKELEKYQS